MIGFNHALTGGLLVKLLPLPIALPAAFLSHFLLDMVPHYGIHNSKRDNSTFWKVFFTLDAFATLGLAVYAVYSRQYFMFLGGFLATMPDYIWVGRVIKTRSFDLSNNTNRFTKWHSGIQGLERPWGLWLEIPLAALLFYFVMIVLW